MARAKRPQIEMKPCGLEQQAQEAVRVTIASTGGLAVRIAAQLTRGLRLGALLKRREEGRA
eukprot:6762819-Prymnesium_polylepis.1